MNEQNRSNQSKYGWLILLFLGAFFVYAGWGWTYQLWDRQEVLPGGVMRSLLNEGGWLMPAAEAGLVPPLYYWITGVLVRGLGSAHAFVLRLPAMCSAAVMVAVTAGITARVVNRRTGLLAGAITGTAAFFAWKATRMTPAFFGALFLIGGMYLLYEAKTVEKRARSAALTAFFLFGLGFLSVGPVALFPPVMFGLFDIIGKLNGKPEKARVPWGTGTLIMFVVAGVWLVPVAWFKGGSGMYQVFADPVSSFSPGNGPGDEPVWFYARSLVLHFLPWTLFLLLGIPEVIRSTGKRRFLRIHVFFVVFYVLIFSVLSAKEGVVLFPVYPSLGIVTAMAIERRFLRSSQRRGSLFLVGSGLGVCFLCAAVVVGIRGPDLLLQESYIRPLPVNSLVSSYTVAGVLFCYGLMMAGCAWKRAPRWLLGSTATGMAVLLLTVKLVVAPNLDARENLRSEPLPAEGVQNLSLTWEKRDMVRTMTVNFQTRRGSFDTRVLYDTRSRDGRPRLYRHRQEGSNRTVDRLKRTIHHATLTGLKPDTTYYFVAGSPEVGYSDERRFRTLPEKGEVRFLAGGDQGTSPGFRALNRVAAKTNPHFALIGGDIAYADGRWRNTATWNAWHRIWNRTMKGRDGRMIPMVLALGNHERNRRSAEEVKGDRFEMAPFYFHYFEQGDQAGYFGKTVADRLYIMTLDTGYVSGIEEQGGWIRSELRARRDRAFRIALYHRPMYPAVKDAGGVVKRMRTYWEPLFHQYGLDVAFEHDGHVLKRTYRLDENGKRSEDGIPYLGEGAWGVTPRTPATDRPYLKTVSGKRHVWVVTMHRDRMKLKAIGRNGNVLDKLTVRRRSPSESED